MELFVLERHYNYEGFDILGIYDSLEEAEKVREETKDRGDGLDITTHTLNERNED